jgi:hypothetical protein
MATAASPIRRDKLRFFTTTLPVTGPHGRRTTNCGSEVYALSRAGLDCRTKVSTYLP